MEKLFDAIVQKAKNKHGMWHFDCPLGLFGVAGMDKIRVQREAYHYFTQYYADGEYDKLIEKYGMKKHD